MDDQSRKQALIFWVQDCTRPSADNPQAQALESLYTAIGTSMDDVLAPYLQTRLVAIQADLQAQLDSVTTAQATLAAAPALKTLATG